MRKIFGLVLVFFVIVGIAASNATAKDSYPSKPITITQSYSAGGSTDLAARAIANTLSKYMNNQPVSVQPKPGGSGIVALSSLLNSKPDGYTIHLGRPGDMMYGPFINKVPFDVLKDFVPVAQTGNDEMLIVASTKATNWKSIEDMIAAFKKAKGKMKFATSSPASSTRIVFEAFCKLVGIKGIMVPFKGSAPACIAVAGGHLPVVTPSISEALPHVKRGDLIPLMMVGDRRCTEFPDCPTPKEKGYDFSMSSWHVVFVPSKVPADRIAKIQDALKKVCADEGYIKAMKTLGSDPIYTPGKEWTKQWMKQRKVVGELIQELGLNKAKK